MEQDTYALRAGIRLAMPALWKDTPEWRAFIAAHSRERSGMMNTLQTILGGDEAKAEATLDGVTMLVEQYLNPFTSELFWIWGEASKRTEIDGCDVTYDGEYMDEELFDAGCDPDALSWQPA